MAPEEPRINRVSSGMWIAISLIVLGAIYLVDRERQRAQDKDVIAATTRNQKKAELLAYAQYADLSTKTRELEIAIFATETAIQFSQLPEAETLREKLAGQKTELEGLKREQSRLLEEIRRMGKE